jgi:hypothetical protein
MIRFRTNSGNMNRKQLAENQRIVTGFFVIFFFAGLWMTHTSSQFSVQAAIFHAILLLNTYFSIKCFGRLTPLRASWQGTVDMILVLIYAILPFCFGFASLYILLLILLFSVAAMKYALLIGFISDTVLLRRKIIIDVSGVLWNFSVFLIGSLGLLPIDFLLWMWVGVFAVMNIYLLKIKPMYCLTTP